VRNIPYLLYIDKLKYLSNIFNFTYYEGVKHLSPMEGRRAPGQVVHQWLWTSQK